jgi:hypothetical protein
MNSKLKSILITLSTLASLLCSYFFYEFYLSRDFNSEGNAFDAATGVNYQEGSSLWGILAVAFAIPPLIALSKKFKS